MIPTRFGHSKVPDTFSTYHLFHLSHDGDHSLAPVFVPPAKSDADLQAGMFWVWHFP